MTTRQAILMLCDAGSSMDQMHSQNTSRLKLAMSCIMITLKQKVFQNSTHEIAFALFGERDSPDYFLLQPFTRPNTELIRKIYQLSQAQLSNDLKGGDIFLAIDRGIDDMENKYRRTKNINRRMFVFTNGMGKTIYRLDSVEYMATKLANAEIKLNVIPINFMEGYAMEENQVETEIIHEEQTQNARLLMDLKAAAPNNVEIFPDEIATELYNKFRKRDVNPVAIYKGMFEVAPGLTINVETYKMVRRERMKALQKYDVNVPFNPTVTKEKEIIIQTKYIVQGDQTSTRVEPEDRMNAYPYGPNLLPLSTILEKDSKWQEDRNLKLLGFVSKQEIPRHAFMSEVELMVPSKGMLNIEGQKLFTSLVYCMLLLKKYAICRYVPRNSKNGVIPRLVALMPWRSGSREGMHLVELPTVEDVREYPFNSMKTATEEQRDLVKEIVKSGSLYQKIGDEEFQDIKVENTFNPAIQYFFQAVFYRALNDDDELPEPDQAILDYLRPELRFYQQTKTVMKNIKKAFKLTNKPLPKEKALNKLKALTWKEVMDNEMPEIAESATMSESGQQHLKPHKIFDLENEEDKFNESDPLRSFNSMLSNNKVDLVKAALTGMSGYIYAKSMGTVSKQMFQGLVQCASALRRGCDEQQERDYWDEWLTDAKEHLNQNLFRMMIEQGLMYFKKDNRQLARKEVRTPLVTTEEEFADLD